LKIPKAIYNVYAKTVSQKFVKNILLWIQCEIISLLFQPIIWKNLFPTVFGGEKERRIVNI